MTLILDRRWMGSPGVHAILIGVGTFYHANAADLLGADGPAGGFVDLETPLHSVEAFADWLQSELDVVDTPLMTLRVLGSSSTRSSRLGVAAPTFDNIADAVGEWSDDVDSHEDNLAIFYFCGHGLRIGETQFLLAEDFGANRRAPFENAIEPELLANAMRQKRGQRQLFLIDACSTEVPFRSQYQNVTPRTIVQAARNENLARSEQCLMRASRLGTQAFGRGNGPSLFMDAFLRAMKGAGAVSTRNRQWVINTDMLRMALSWLIQVGPDGQGQEVSFGGGTLSSNVAFHKLAGNPLVPVRVSCEPREFEAWCALRVDNSLHHSAGGWPKSFDVERRPHDFEAVEITAAGTEVHGQALQELISPPFMDVSIPCGEP